MWTAAFTILFWAGAGLMTGGAAMIVLALVGAAIAGALGWEFNPWD